MFHENLGNKFYIHSILKPNALLVKVVENVQKLFNGFTKQDHIFIVEGP
jgi:hypothetical protein